LNNTGHTDGFCPIEVLSVIHRVLAIGKLEMGVIVIDRNLKGLWFWRVGEGSISGL
jgi:hypothetical protein